MSPPGVDAPPNKSESQHQDSPQVPAESSRPGSDTANGAVKEKQKESARPGKTSNVAGKATEKSTAPQSGEKQLSNAELKKQKQAEKAARRAQAKGLGGAQEQSSAAGKGEPSADAGKSVHGSAGQSGGGKSQHKRSQSAQRNMPVRPKEAVETAKPAQQKKDLKKVALFGHLYAQTRRTTLAGASKDVHPAILALGLQMSSYKICGSSARCVATLLAFKRVIQSYTTPHMNSLPRHLTTHLNSQIEYLVSCRPLATSTGNAIRWLKLEISSIDPSVDEDEAKADLCADIDRFIQERITFADRAISSTSVSKIQENDTILTFGKSNIVQQTLLAAHSEGKRFKVVVVDSRPLFEGRKIARVLSDAGLDVQYTLTHGLARVIKNASKVLLGAHSMLGNGRLYARAGSALVAMMAKNADVPVIVCCESLKFTDRVALDSIVTNEVAPADELILGGDRGKKGSLDGWKEKDGLHMLNLMYDVTPAEYVAMVVTEYGCLPPSSVPVVHRLSTNT